MSIHFIWTDFDLR